MVEKDSKVISHWSIWRDMRERAIPLRKMAGAVGPLVCGRSPKWHVGLEECCWIAVHHLGEPCLDSYWGSVLGLTVGMVSAGLGSMMLFLLS